MNQEEFRKFTEELRQYLKLEYCIMDDDYKTTAKFSNQKKEMIIKHRRDEGDILLWSREFENWIRFDYIQIDSVSSLFVSLDLGGNMRINLRRES